MQASAPNRIIDFHVHVFPDALAPAALSQLEARSGCRAHHSGTLSGLKQSMSRHGIHTSIIQPVATKPAQTEVINRQSAIWNQAEGLVAFGTLHPAMTRAALQAEMDFLTSQSIPGIKLHPEYQDFYPDDDRLEPLYAAVAQAGLILLMHAGVDLGFPSPVKAEPSRIAQVVRSFPQLKLVAAHLGGFRQWSAVERHLVGLPLWLDTGYCAGECDSRQLLEISRAHGSERILFASDSPWGDQGQHVALIRQAGFTPEEEAAILGQNASHVLSAAIQGDHAGFQTLQQARDKKGDHP